MTSIRPERADDYTAIGSVLTQAFGCDNEARLVARLRGEPGFDPELSLVAVYENEIVGHVLFVAVRVEASTQDSYGALALAPVAVRPDRQRQGIGSALIHHGLERCKETPFESVIVFGDPRYYARFGFVPAARYGIVPPFPAPPEAFMIVPLNERTMLRAGVVRYPSAFDDV